MAASRNFTAMFWILALSMPAAAGQRLNLSEALQHARDHAPRFLAARAEIDNAQRELVSARAKRWFSVDFVSQHGVEKSWTLTPPEPSPAENRSSPWRSSMGLELKQPLLDNGTTSQEINASALKVQKAQLDLEKISNDLAYEVVKAYYALARSEAQLKIQQKRLTQQEKQYRTTLAQHQQGFKPRKDVLRLQADVARSQLDAKKTILDSASRKLELVDLLGIYEQTETITFVTPDLGDADGPTPAVPVFDPKKETIAQRLAAAEDAIEEASVAKERLNGMELDLSAQLKRETRNYLGTGTPIWDNDTTTGSLMLTFKYNLWDAGTRRRRIESALASRQQKTETAQANARSERQKMQATLNTIAYDNEVLASNRQVVTLERESFANVEREYREGTVNYLDYAKAVETLFDTELQAFTAYLAVHEGLAQYYSLEGTVYERLGPHH